MKVKARQRNGATILELEGKVVYPQVVSALRDAVKDALAAGSKAILLDLEKATTIDSAGIGELVVALTSTTHRGGQLKLLKPSPKVREILSVTHLSGIFEIFDYEDMAIESFAGSPAGVAAD